MICRMFTSGPCIPESFVSLVGLKVSALSPSTETETRRTVMDSYEYDGYTVLAVGMDEELAMLHGVEEIGQVVYGISRGGNQCHCH